jgi:excisionase family DNA binding protein
MKLSLSDKAPVLTVRDLSTYLRVHPSTVYRLLRTGQLPAFKVGSDWRFNIEEIDRWRIEREKKLDM